MGHSEYDPAFAERRPWNAARKPGAKRAFKSQQVPPIGLNRLAKNTFLAEQARQLHDRMRCWIRARPNRRICRACSQGSAYIKDGRRRHELRRAGCHPN